MSNFYLNFSRRTYFTQVGSYLHNYDQLRRLAICTIEKSAGAKSRECTGRASPCTFVSSWSNRLFARSRVIVRYLVNELFFQTAKKTDPRHGARHGYGTTRQKWNEMKNSRIKNCNQLRAQRRAENKFVEIQLLWIFYAAEFYSDMELKARRRD